MYMFELLAEYHLPQEQIVASRNDFMQLFSMTLQDSDVKVKSAAMRALTVFLTMIEDEDQVMEYQNMMGSLLDLVIAALQVDEE
jgi:hypothetical protein